MSETPNLSGVASATGESPRVLVLTNLFPNHLQPGRAPFNRQQFAHLGQLTDVEVYGVVPKQLGRHSIGRLNSHEMIDDLKVHHPQFPSIPGLPTLNAGFLAARLIRHLRRRSKDFDVILASYAYPDGCAGILLGRALGLPVVVKCHGSDLNRVPEDPGPKLQLKILLPRADALVVVSKKLGDAAQSLGVSDSKIHLVYNGVDRERFLVQERDSARRELGIDLEAELLVCVSHLDEHKGTLDLLDAVEHVSKNRPGVQFAFVGDGPLLSEVQSRARRYAKEDANIIAVGRVEHTEVPKWMAASDFVCLPSWDEGMPNVVREAHVMGRAVIATDVGGIPEAVHMRNLGRLVKAKDPKNLASAICDAFQEGAPTASQVIQKASVPGWEESAQTLLQVLCSVT